MKYLSLLNKRFKKYREEKLRFKNSEIKFFNFWDIENNDDFWFGKFITDRKLNPKNKKINFFSVFGPRVKVKLESSDIKIFFSGENLVRFKKYKDYCLNDVDLALGFEEIKNDRYLRFPLWIMNFFNPTDSVEIITEKFNKISFYNNHPITERPNFCALIASHDENGLRKSIVNSINKIEPVDCAGKFLKNTSVLKTEFGDDKSLFLQSYKFNICPENTTSNGYVTEKLFESFAAGCIPIYWGALENPEPNVINKNAVLFYNSTGGNDGLLKTIEALHTNESAYKDFLNQNPILPNAADFIFDKLNALDLKISQLIKNL